MRISSPGTDTSNLGLPVRNPFVSMLKWAFIFAIIALIAGALGFTGIAGASAAIAKVLFFIFLLLVVLFVVAAVFIGKKIT